MMKLAIILLFFCFLAGCSETVCLRNDEKPVLVLNAVLEAGCDSMRIELTETDIPDRSLGGRERDSVGGYPRPGRGGGLPCGVVV